MKAPALAALVAATTLGLAACSRDADEAATKETTVIEATAPVPVPTATETRVVETPAPTPSSGNTVSVGPNGVSAQIDSGGTTVKATTD